MDRIWQWTWDRYGSRYSWALWAIVFQFLLLIYLVPSFVVVTFEKSDRYLEAAAVTAVGVLVLVYMTLLPGLGGIRLAEQCAAGHEVDRAKALQATYTWARRTVVRAVVSNAVWLAVILVVVGAIGGGDVVAAGPVRNSGRRLRNWRPGDRCAQLRGSRTATCQGRHRR